MPLRLAVEQLALIAFNVSLLFGTTQSKKHHLLRKHASVNHLTPPVRSSRSRYSYHLCTGVILYSSKGIFEVLAAA
jgi:hypothetical protein